MEESHISNAEPHQESHLSEPRGVSWVLMALGFLLPIFLIPSTDFPLAFTKTILGLVFIALLFFLFTISTFKKAGFSFSFSLPFVAVVFLPVAYLVSSFFSPVPMLSLFGYQLDSDTFGFVTLSSALTLTVLLSITNIKQTFSLLLGLFWAGVVTVLFQMFQLFGNAPLPIPALDAPYVNLIGSWNGLAVFLGLIISLLLVAVGSLKLSKLNSLAVQGMLVLSLFVLAVVNFITVWIMIALVAFVMLVSSLNRMFSASSDTKPSPYAAYAGVTLVVALFFTLFGANVGTGLQDAFKIQTLDVRPSVQATVNVMQAAYTKSPVFGTGPNTFSSDWFLYRPNGIIATPFWDVAFNGGFASIPTAMVTGGLVVTLAWLFLIIAVCWSTFRALLFATNSENHSYFLVVATAVGSLYLLAMHLVYTPEPNITLLMFLFFGLFLSSVRGGRLSKEISVSFKTNPRIGFASVLVILIFGVVALASLYGAGSLYASTVANQEANRYAAVGEIDTAREKILSAIGFSAQDRYYRSLSAIELARLNAVVSNGATDTAAQSKFRETLSSAIQAATRATELNPASYENQLTRASVYASVVPLKIDGAYDAALLALNEARKYNPQTPEVDYRIAQIKASLNDAPGTRASAEDALKRKADYTPAILLLAQVSLSEGKLTEAIQSVASALVLEPQNAQLAYQLGLLNLQAKKYADARDAFQVALSVTPDYANASFFLGQAYYMLDEKDNALKEFKALLEKNADNTTLTEVIASIETGKNPFAPAPASPDDVKTPTK